MTENRLKDHVQMGETKMNTGLILSPKTSVCVCVCKLTEVTGVLFLLAFTFGCAARLVACSGNSIKLTRCVTRERYHLSKSLTLRVC